MLRLPLRHLRLTRLLRILTQALLIVAAIALATFLTSLFAALFPIASAPVAIAVSGKRNRTDNRQQQCHACSTDRVIAHVFLS